MRNQLIALLFCALAFADFTYEMQNVTVIVVDNHNQAVRDALVVIKYQSRDYNKTDTEARALTDIYGEAKFTLYFFVPPEFRKQKRNITVYYPACFRNAKNQSFCVEKSDREYCLYSNSTQFVPCEEWKDSKVAAEYSNYTNSIANGVPLRLNLFALTVKTHPNATVVFGSKVKTAINGTATFVNIPGTYLVTVYYKAGTFQKNVTLEKGKNKEVEIFFTNQYRIWILDENGKELSGVVTAGLDKFSIDGTGLIDTEVTSLKVKYENRTKIVKPSAETLVVFDLSPPKISNVIIDGPDLFGKVRISANIVDDGNYSSGLKAVYASLNGTNEQMKSEMGRYTYEFTIGNYDRSLVLNAEDNDGNYAESVPYEFKGTSEKPMDVGKSALENASFIFLFVAVIIFMIIYFIEKRNVGKKNESGD